MTSQLKIVFAFILIFMLLTFPACARNEPQKKDYKVEILLFGSHPLLRSVAEGIDAGARERLRSLGRSESISFNINDANFQVIEATQQTKQALLRQPTAIVALGTPSIKAALANRDSNIPMYFGAASDPQGLKIATSNDPEDWQKPGAFTVDPNVFGIITDFQYGKVAQLIEKVTELNRRQGQTGCIKVGYPLNEAESNSVLALQKIDDFLPDDKFCFIRAQAPTATEIPGAARFLMNSNVSVIQVGPDNTVAGGIGSLLSIVTGKHVPVLASERESVKRGALAAFGVDFFELGKRLGAKLVDNLVQANTGSPVEVFSKSKLYVNPQTVKDHFQEEAVQSFIEHLGISGNEVEYVQ